LSVSCGALFLCAASFVDEILPGRKLLSTQSSPTKAVPRYIAGGVPIQNHAFVYLWC
jgi:hypothetical protein